MANRTVFYGGLVVVLAGAGGAVFAYIQQIQKSPSIELKPKTGASVDGRAALGPAVTAILDAPDDMQLELLAAKPGSVPAIAKMYPVHKTVSVAPDARKAVIDAIYEGIASGKGQGALSYDPHHVLHVKKGGASVDIEIAFEDNWLHAVLPNVAPIAVETSPAAKAKLDELLAAAK